MAATPTSARRLTPKGEATRARIIELAAEVFATEGYAKAAAYVVKIIAGAK